MNEVEVDSAGLLHVLNRLVTALEPSQTGEPVVDVQCLRSPERWEDKDYVYMEASLADGLDSDIDISIHSGLVFIRIVR